jgi:nicotinate-nucleotide adenylyltransferase
MKRPRLKQARRPAPGGRPKALRLGFALQSGMRVGLFGGSFNPAHEGHAHAAETARKRLGLDLVIWLVTPRNPFKAAPAPLESRTGSARRQARPPSVVSDAERRLGASYTIDTVRLMKARFPGVHFVWVMGADGLAELHRWRDWMGLMRELPVAVIARPGATLRGLESPAARRFPRARIPAAAARRLPGMKPPAWVYLTGPWNYASSTALRALASARET